MRYKLVCEFGDGLFSACSLDRPKVEELSLRRLFVVLINQGSGSGSKE
jgi:hypothetical protein